MEGAAGNSKDPQTRRIKQIRLLLDMGIELAIMTRYDKGTILILIIAILLPTLAFIVEGLKLAIEVLVGVTTGFACV